MEEAVGIIIVICILFAFCVGIGMVAEKNGRSFWGFTLLSVFFSPVLALIIVLILGKSEEQVRREIEARVRYEEYIRRKIRHEESMRKQGDGCYLVNHLI